MNFQKKFQLDHLLFFLSSDVDYPITSISAGYRNHSQFYNSHPAAFYALSSQYKTHISISTRWRLCI